MGSKWPCRFRRSVGGIQMLHINKSVVEGPELVAE
eukprot:SAG11_NODE_32090_length_286_cov_1.101604_1_plen_34_part_10